MSPLELAADCEPNQETVQMTRLLISFGADVNGFKCKPSLQVAIEALGNGVECSHTSSSVNLVSEGCLGVLFAILEAKPDLEARPSLGANSLKLAALGLAVKLGQLYTAKVLISYGANMFSVQRTYLDSACPETETDPHRSSYFCPGDAVDAPYSIIKAAPDLCRYIFASTVVSFQPYLLVVIYLMNGTFGSVTVVSIIQLAVTRKSTQAADPTYDTE